MKKIIALLVALSFVLIVGCGGTKSTSTGGAPEKVVKSFFDAIKADKYEEAYGYWKTTQDKTSWIEGKKANKKSGYYDSVSVKNPKVTGDKATVDVEFAGLPMTYALEKINGAWKITSNGMGGTTGGTMPPATGGTTPSTGGTTGGTANGTNPHANGTIPIPDTTKK